MRGSIEGLESRNLLLENHVLPALRGELASGREAPYEFDCTLVRVDVNDFSTIFNNHPIEPFMATINGFFETVSHIVDRYGGYVYEFIGDEVVFYFKDTESSNSALSAIASLRDICNAAEALDARVVAEHGYNFRVKCSAARGKLRFGRQVTGHSLAGAILIDTVRILSQIEEKQQNTIFFDDSVASRVSGLVRSRVEKEVVLKGSSSSRVLHRYLSFDNLSSVLQTRERFAEVGFYRCDEDLGFLLAHLADRELDRADYLRIIGELRGLRIRIGSPALAGSYKLLLESLLGPIDEDSALRISAALALAKNLLTPDIFESTMRPLFEAYLEAPERRVVANAIETFSYFEAIAEDAALAEFMRNKDNRIAANAIVRDGMRELSKDVVKNVATLLAAKNPLYVASGIFAIGELAAYHRAKNPVYLETHAAFEVLLKQATAQIDHTDPMVRRQALIAARKANELRDEAA